jgi:hypothetical protein
MYGRYLPLVRGKYHRARHDFCSIPLPGVIEDSAAWVQQTTGWWLGLVGLFRVARSLEGTSVEKRAPLSQGLCGSLSRDGFCNYEESYQDYDQRDYVHL